MKSITQQLKERVREWLNAANDDGNYIGETDDLRHVGMDGGFNLEELTSITITELIEHIEGEMVDIDVDKVPSIQDEAWANQYDSKAEAFWYGQAQTTKEVLSLLSDIKKEVRV